MANLTPNVGYTHDLYRIETDDLVQGGEEGIDNIQAKQIAGSLKFLKEQQDNLTGDLSNTNGSVTTLNNSLNTTKADVTALQNKTGQPRGSFAVPSNDFPIKLAHQGVVILTGNFNVILPSLVDIANGLVNSEGGVFIIYCSRTDVGKSLIKRDGTTFMFQGQSVSEVTMRGGDLFYAYVVSGAIYLSKVVTPDRTVPIGSIVYWPHDIKPDAQRTGWIECLGQDDLSKTQYSELFAIVGTQYGAGNGAGTFKIINSPGYLVKALN